MARKKTAEELMLEAELGAKDPFAMPRDTQPSTDKESTPDFQNTVFERPTARPRFLQPKVLAIVLAALLVAALAVVIGLRQSLVHSTDVWDGTADTSWYSDGLEAMEITTAEQLAGMRELCNDGTNLKGISFTLARDLDLFDIPTKPIGDGTQDAGQTMNFAGSFDGDGHTITGINVEEDQWDYAGLFGIVVGGDIRNLTVEGKVTGQVHVGGIAGCMEGGSIVNCTNRCKVSSLKTATSYYPVSADVGGVCGIWLGIADEGVDHASIANLVNEGDVSARACSAGGVIGTIANTVDFTLEVSDLVNNGSVTVYCESDDRDEAVGGVVGVVGAMGTDNISNLVNNGDVSCSTVLSVGGVFGAFMPPPVKEKEEPAGELTEGATVKQCSNAARIAANAQDERAHVGGLVGYLNDPDVVFEECENSGELAATNGNSDDLFATDGAEVWDAWEEAHPQTYY